MDKIRLLIILDKNGVKEYKDLSITKEQSIEIKNIMSENNEDKLVDFFKNITDIYGVIHNIDFNEVEGFELGI